MVQIQLIEANEGYLDVKAGTVFPLNFSLTDIRDISKRKGVFSRTIELEGSKENARLLNYYFDVNVTSNNATFNINKRQKCFIIQNGVKLRDELYLQLLEVNVVDEIVQSYSVEIKDAIADLFNEINNKLLTDIDFSDDNHQLTVDAITDSFNNDSTTSNYKYHLTSNSDETYLLSQFKPAIYGIKYWDRIHSNAGFEWEWADYDDEETQFDKYILPCTRSVIDSSQPLQVKAEISSEVDKDVTAISSTGVSSYHAYQNSQVIIFDTEIEDPFTLYDPTTGIYTSNLNYPAGQSLIFTLDVRVSLTIENLENEEIEAVTINGGTPTGFQRYKNLFYVEKGNQFFAIGSSTFNDSDGLLLNGGTTIDALDTVVVDTKSLSFNIAVSNVNELDELKMRIGNVISRFLRFEKVSDNTDANIVETITIEYATLSIKPNTNQGYYLGSIVEMNNFIPDKIKQSDFLKDVIIMNNLWMEIDPTNPNKIIYTKRNTYLDVGRVVNMSKKICLDKDIKLQFLPELSKKKKILTYKADKDLLNETYTGATGEIYGQVEFTFQNEYVRDTETTQLVASPTPLHKTVFGAFVPAINGAEPKHNYRILLDNGVRTCGEYYIQSAPGTVTAVTSYPFVGHFDDPINPTFDLNFAICDYFYYGDIQTFTNNGLFNLNYRRQFNQIDTGQMLRALFDLNEYDIQTFKPNDKWWVYGAYWHVNKIIDYNANRKDENSSNYFTRVELIPVDTEAEIKFLKRSVGGVVPVRPVPPGKNVGQVGGLLSGNTLSNGVNQWTGIVDKSLNSIMSESSNVQVIGKNNFVLGSVKNGVVVGSGMTVENEGVTATAVTVGSTLINESGIETENLLVTEQAEFENPPTINGVPMITNSIYTGSGTVPTSVDVAITNFINFASNLLYLSATSGRVGIGTNSPSYKLDVNGVGQFYGEVKSTGGTLNIANTYSGSDWVAGDVVGTLNFRITDPSTTEPIRGQIQIVSQGGTAYPSLSSMAFSTTNGNTKAEAMRIRYDGNIGIGTNNPSWKLDVNGVAGIRANSQGLNLVGTNHFYMAFYPNNIAGGRKAYLGFGGASNPTFTIQNEYTDGHISIGTTVTGNVGINTTSPTKKLDVNGDLRIRTIPTGTIVGNLGYDSNGNVIQGETVDESLDEVLANGNETLGNDITMTSGDVIDSDSTNVILDLDLLSLGLSGWFGVSDLSSGLLVDESTGLTAVSGANKLELNSTIVSIVGLVQSAFQVRSASGTLGASVTIVDSNSLTLTLPSAVGIGGVRFEVKNRNVTLTTIDTTSSETIDGSATYVMAGAYDFATFVSDGANWLRIG